MPRLKDDEVFQRTLAAGAESRDFFGFAQGKEQEGDGLRYFGFVYGKRSSLILDKDLLLIAPDAAAAYAKVLEEQTRKPEPSGKAAGDNGKDKKEGGDKREDGGDTKGGSGTTQTVKKHFYASIDLEPVLAKKQFADVVDEVIQQFTTRADVKVQIAIEIQAESASGFDEGLQRAVKENCGVLKFKTAEFEQGE